MLLIMGQLHSFIPTKAGEVNTVVLPFDRYVKIKAWGHFVSWQRSQK